MAKLYIDENAKKTTTNLLKQLKKATTNPSIQAIQKLEKDRMALLDKTVAQWNEPSTLKMIKQFKDTIKASSSAFTSVQDLEKLSKPLFSTLELKGIEAARKSLIDIPAHYKQSSLLATSTLKELQKTLGSSSIQSALPKLSELKFIQDSIKMATENIASNKSMMEATKSLRDVSKSIVSDSFQKKIENNRLESIQYEPLNIPHFKIQENPLIAQNDTLIEVSNLQNNILNDISEFMRLQNDAINNQLEELKIQNNSIDNQLEELQKQNQFVEKQISQKDREIDANRKTSKNTLIIAIISILLSVIASYMSYKATFEVYEKEKVDNNKDNVILLKAINDKATQNNQLSLIIKEMKQQNKLLEEQNRHLKDRDKIIKNSTVKKSLTVQNKAK